jgi:hypothetical protein
LCLIKARANFKNSSFPGGQAFTIENLFFMSGSSDAFQIEARSLSKLICNSAFKGFIDESTDKQYVDRLRRLLMKFGVSISKKDSVKDVLDFSYSYLCEHYKYEYVYKSGLLNNFILSQFSLDDTVILNEFKIAKSKADVVLVNGTNKVFEIKTELDTPDRLKTQIQNYYKAFNEVYIVTFYTLTEKYERLLPDEVGIISMETDSSMQVAKKASKVTEYLNSETMMRTLRKSEYLYLVESLVGYVPMVADTVLFKTCLKELEMFDPVLVQQRFLEALKMRIVGEQPYLRSNLVPDYFKYVCHNLNLNESQYLSLIKKLSYRVTNY